MTIPTSGSYTSEQVRAEWGFTAPFTSSQVSAAAGLNTPWTSDQLRGKSARSVSIIITQSNTVTTGTGLNRQSYTRIVFGVSVSDGATPSSYVWSGEYLNTSTSTATFTGPTYNPSGFTFQDSSTVYVDVVIAGQTYSANYTFSYTRGDDV